MYREAGARRRVYFNPQHAAWNLSTYNTNMKVLSSSSSSKAGCGMATSTRMQVHASKSVMSVHQIVSPREREESGDETTGYLALSIT